MSTGNTCSERAERLMAFTVLAPRFFTRLSADILPGGMMTNDSGTRGRAAISARRLLANGPESRNVRSPWRSSSWRQYPLRVFSQAKQ